MALQGFDSSYYLSAKLAALQAIKTEWADKDAAFLETVLSNVYGLTAEEHYQLYGYNEGLAPNAYFNADEYVLAKANAMFDAGKYLSVADAQAAFEAAWTGNAYEHYLQYGSAEGINPSNSFDESSYLADKLAALQAADSATYGSWTTTDLQEYFESIGMTALGHYILYGADEGLTVTEVPASEQVDSSDTAVGVTGETYTLTTAIDTLTGTSNNDTFITDAGSASAADQIDGGSGTDTMKIYGLTGTTALPNLTSVEVIELENATAGLDVTGVSELTTLGLDNSSTGLTYTIGADVAVELDGMADAEIVTLTSTTTDTTQDISVTDMGTIAGAGVTVNADGAAVSTINLTATGTVAANTDSNITLASTGTETSVSVTGSGDLALTTAASVVALDASGATGDLTYTSGATTASTSITTGSGDDTVTAIAAVDYTIDLGSGDDTLVTSDAAGELTSADSIVGGEGTDTLGISSAEAEALDDDDTADNAVLAVVTGFEQLRITDAVAGTIDIGNLGYNYLQVTTALGADQTITGFTSGMTFESRLAGNAANNYIIGMDGATGAGTSSDTINILLNADLTANDTMYSIGFDLEGINIVNVTASDRTTSSNPDSDDNGEEGYTIDLAGGTAGHSANITTINVDGTQQVSYTVNAATTALATYDASSATGEQEVTATAFAGTQGITITGGSGADTLIGSGLADIISGGAGKDAITGGAGADTLTGGDAVDTFTFANTDTGLPTATNFDTITDFETGTDIIDGPVALTISQSATATAGVAAINAEGIASFNVADDTLAEKLTAVAAGVEVATATTAGDIAIFEHDGDSYLFITDATAGLSATDVLVELTGVTDLSDSTITAGDLVIA